MQLTFDRAAIMTRDRVCFPIMDFVAVLDPWQKLIAHGVVRSLLRGPEFRLPRSKSL